MPTFRAAAMRQTCSKFRPNIFGSHTGLTPYNLNAEFIFKNTDIIAM